MRTLIILCLLLSPLVAIGKNAAHETVTFEAERFESQRAEIEKAMAGDKYSELTVEQREQVRQALQQIQQLLDGEQPMPEADRVKLFNAQELVNTLLTQAADDSRVICKREAKMGSHMKVNICKTVAERRREREESLDGVRGRPGLPVDQRG